MTTDDTDKQADLSRFDEVLALSHAPEGLREFLAVYEISRGNAVAPSRNNLDMRSLAKFLPEMSIMERTAPGVVIHRLAGTGLVERIGHDFTGQSVLPLIAKMEAERIDQGVMVVGEIPCGTFSLYENTYSSGRRVQTETLGLPLDRGTGKPPYLFLGLHRALSVIDYQDMKEDRVIDSNWMDGVAIDLGYGVPDSSVMDILTRRA